MATTSRGREDVGTPFPALTTRSVTARLLRPTEMDKWETEEVADVCHWIRQIIGLVCGVVWGMAEVRGWTGLLTFTAVNLLIAPTIVSARLYCETSVMQEALSFEMTRDAFVNSFCLMLVAWIVTHTAMQPSIAT
ncbi:hypothetical protein KFE25_006640 [Diacronema lutheri]|uniref:ER membrane protein complex subunit 6 n=1 Tax=Diacronema lutheri TaxID=2081491 RepID=A0A8J6CHC0_DIALT|nr:hypothetical protein KFE25_006640 [Diacronema lutheri]